jgi:Flp pilus assembly protein TadD
MKSIMLALALALSLAGGGAWAIDQETVRSEPASPDLEEGRRAIEKKDFSLALKHLTRAAEEMPKDADVHNLLGYAYRHLRQYDKAFEHYRIALKLDPNHRGAHEYLGELYLETGHLANAEKQLQALRRACPWFGRCPEYEELKEAIERHKAKKGS